MPDEDVRFLLDTINRVLERPLGASDVVGRFAGLRPLVRGPAVGESADVSRRHLLLDEPGRPVTIAGGKLTTYRQMAQDAVDAVCRRAGIATECRTRTLPLVGAAQREALARVPAPTAARAALRHRGGRGGTSSPSMHPDLAVPVSDSCPTIGAEMLFGVLHEGALTVEDLVERRTRVSFDEAALPSARRIAERALEVADALDPS